MTANQDAYLLRDNTQRYSLTCLVVVHHIDDRLELRTSQRLHALFETTVSSTHCRFPLAFYTSMHSDKMREPFSLQLINFLLGVVPFCVITSREKIPETLTKKIFTHTCADRNTEIYF